MNRWGTVGFFAGGGSSPTSTQHQQSRPRPTRASSHHHGRGVLVRSLLRWRIEIFALSSAAAFGVTMLARLRFSCRCGAA
jgi:hypothetical protein